MGVVVYTSRLRPEREIEMPNRRSKRTICYLCGKTLSEPTDKDHIPLKALLPPTLRQRHKPNKLLSVRVHKSCNQSYHSDEQYFIYSLYPFALGAYVGDAMRQHIRKKLRAGENQKLMGSIMAEFDHRPSGLVLPHNQVVKRFDSKRIERVLWKIVRGLNFHHHNEVFPENWQWSWSFTAGEDRKPPEHFNVFLQLPDNEPNGDYPAVFSYRFQHFVEAGVSFHYWALLIWDSILVTIQFHDPACGCQECVPQPE
jgi:hypothetical protein